MVYYNLHITGQYTPLYTLNNPGFVVAHMKTPFTCLLNCVLIILQLIIWVVIYHIYKTVFCLLDALDVCEG